MRVLLIIVALYSFLFSFEIQKPKTYNEQNISGWMMSEKLDGVRAYWDGKKLYTKKGNLIHTPKGFTKNFPPYELDGELWSKRGDFEFIQSTVLDKTPSKNWNQITYNIFEVPHAKNDFPIRIAKAKEWFVKHPNKYVRIIEQRTCQNEEHLMRYLEEVVALDGEGVIVKDPKQTYHTGRSAFVLKVKKAYDMEASVVGHNYREDGTLKSLQVRLDNGVEFKLGGGFSEKQRINPPTLGMLVTFKYYDFTKNGKPKFASFLRVRKVE